MNKFKRMSKKSDESDQEIHSLDIPLSEITGRFATNERVVGQATGYRGDVKKFYPERKFFQSHI